MTTGFKFEGIEESETINESYSASIMDDAQTSMTKDVSVDWHITCTGSVGEKGGTGLYQWMVQSSDKSSWVYTPHTVCRYGSLYNVSPSCPWNACSNGDCSSCKTDWTSNGVEEFLQ